MGFWQAEHFFGDEAENQLRADEGDVAHGFARARCGDCGHDFLIGYSCKCRGSARPVLRRRQR